MRSARALGSAMALLATAAVAAPGDPLVVTSDVVNVRAGPGTDNPVLFHVTRDQQVVELTRTGNWVQVQIPDEAADGWIHQSLLAVTRAGAAARRPRPPAAPDAAVDAVRDRRPRAASAATSPSSTPVPWPWPAWSCSPAPSRRTAAPSGSW